MRKRKPRVSIFVKAAKLQYLCMSTNFADASRYSCDNIHVASGRGYLNDVDTEIDFYAKMLGPEGAEDMFAWWPELPGGKWDHESRILALLLAAEMIRNP